MSLRRVYLDQNAWIKLSRQYYGRIDDDRAAGVLALVLEAAKTERASFPLSSSHYIETYRRGDPASRQRLGIFMAKLSRLHTMASTTTLLEAEVRQSLCALAQLPAIPAPMAFGRGAAHAFGREVRYFTSEESRRRAIAVMGEEGVIEHFETELLAGPPDRLPAKGIGRPGREYAQRQLDFERDTARRLQQWGHSRERAHGLVLQQEADRVAELVRKIAPSMGLDPRAIFAGNDSAEQFMLSLPAKGAVCRMRMTAHENPKFRWDIGDLNDIVALGTAVAYCDVVVAENHWGSILQRHAAHLRADVVRDVLQLPGLLV